MRKKIVLKRKTTPKVVTLTNGTTFTTRCERIRRKNLPTNIKVKKTRTIGPRTQRKKVRFTSSRSLRARRAQTGSGLASNLVTLELNLGSRAINSIVGKKLINKRIDIRPSLFKYRVLKIKSKNFQRALNSNTANYVVNEAQNKVRAKAGTLFD